MSYYIIFILFNNLFKSNKVDVKFYKWYNILLKWIILSFNIILSIRVLVNIGQIM